MKELFLTKREKENNYYRELQNQSFLRLRELSGKVWTDFNTHDPGITITDYLNYGLYDLYYRFTFPLESYLTAFGEDNYKDKGLFSRQELYVDHSSSIRKSIVTEEDYEELIIQQYRKNIEKCTVKLNQKTLKYDIFIISRDRNMEVLSKLEKDISTFYHKYRNIGETLGKIYFDQQVTDDKNHYKRRRYIKDITYQFPEFENASYKQPDNARPFVADYHTIQYEFPENYGISQRGIPQKEDSLYEAKVLQLKAYLLLFDTLMAEQLQSAKNIASLFQLNNEITARKLPDISVIDGERIIDADKKKIAEQQPENHFYEAQKFRYLNLLDALYGENTRTVFGTKNLSELNSKREVFIQKLPFLNEDRFRSFDIYNPGSTATIQDLFDELFNFGMIDYQVSKRNIKIIPDEEFFERYRFLLSPYLDHIEDKTIIEEIPYGRSVYDEKQFYKILRLHFNLVWNGVLFESLLKYGTDLSNYKILNYSNEYILMFFHPERKIGINMSLFFSDKARLIELTYLFCDFIDKYNQSIKLRSFYLVEHILFDFISAEQYNEVSIILPDQLPNEKVEDLLKERLPVHLKATLYYLPEKILKQFHTIYMDWRKALPESANISKHFTEIQSFLIDHRLSSKKI